MSKVKAQTARNAEQKRTSTGLQAFVNLHTRAVSVIDEQKKKAKRKAERKKISSIHIDKLVKTCQCKKNKLLPFCENCASSNEMKNKGHGHYKRTWHNDHVSHST